MPSSSTVTRSIKEIITWLTLRSSSDTTKGEHLLLIWFRCFLTLHPAKSITQNMQQLPTEQKLSFDIGPSLSLSHSRSGGGRVTAPIHSRTQVAPEASRIGCEGVSWPGVPPGVIMGRTLEHQMLDRLVGAVAVRADGRVPAPDTVKVSRHQWRMTSAYLCHRHALVTGSIGPSLSCCGLRHDMIRYDK